MPRVGGGPLGGCPAGAVGAETGLDVTAGACNQNNKGQLFSHGHSVVTSLALAAVNDKKFVGATPETAVCIHYLHDRLMRPLINLEKQLNGLKSNYLQKVFRYHQEGQTVHCKPCVQAAQEASLEVEVMSNSLKLELYKIYQNYNEAFFPQRFSQSDSLNHSCFHFIDTDSVLERDCVCWVQSCQWLSLTQLYFWGLYRGQMLNSLPDSVGAPVVEPAEEPLSPAEPPKPSASRKRPASPSSEADEPDPSSERPRKRSRLADPGEPESPDAVV